MKENLGLNSAQLEAVTAPLGPVLILAGAGSGKTRSLTMRVVYLIKKLKINPLNILAVTFTNKAAGEMKNRIIGLIGKSEGRIDRKIRRSESSDLSDPPILRLPTMGTFHSIGAKILRHEAHLVGLTPNFVIYDDNDQESLLKEILLNLKIDPTKYKPSLFAHIIDQAKNNLQEPEDIAAPTSSGRASPTGGGRDAHWSKDFATIARRVYREYQEQLRKNNAVDFGDLIVLPVRLFQTHPEVLKKYQELWQYILVDEYQDTNHVQYLFAKMLAVAHKNIFVVGDDAQAIYGFRGANLQNILDFEQDYPDCKVIRLEQNYRSTAPILAIAEKIIAQNSKQHHKRLWTADLGGSMPVLFVAEDELAEAYFVAGKIVELQDKSQARGELAYEYEGEGGREEGTQEEGILSRLMHKFSSRVLPKLKNRLGLNQYAILYRTHAQSRVLEEAMIEASIPYQIVGGLKFYERKEIKDVLSLLRLLINPNDIVSLKRVINVPPRGIGAKTFDMLKVALIEKKESELVSLFANKPAIKNFFEMLDFLAKIDDAANLLDLLKQTLKLSGYEVFLRDGSEEGESRWENVQELFNVAGSFRRLPWKEGLVEFLQEVALMTSADEADLNSPKVTLMTLHQAKGLEFKVVFLVGLEEGLLPHARSTLNPNDIAEEVRLAYVGVTRAREKLFLIYAQTRRQYGSRNISVPSRILKAIPEELLEIKH